MGLLLIWKLEFFDDWVVYLLMLATVVFIRFAQSLVIMIVTQHLLSFYNLSLASSVVQLLVVFDARLNHRQVLRLGVIKG